MENENGATRFWRWKEDTSAIAHYDDVLVVTVNQWNGLTSYSQAQFKRVRTSDGLSGRGFIAGDWLLMKLD